MELKETKYKGYSINCEGGVYSSWTRGTGTRIDTDKKTKLSPGLNNGYLQVGLRISKNIFKNESVHVLVCETFHGKRPSLKHTVSHIDGSRDNNKASNLCWETLSQNHKRKIKHGTHDRGYMNSRSKITKEQLVEIREMLKLKKYTHKEIGEKFNVNRVLITKIKNGYRYKGL